MWRLDYHGRHLLHQSFVRADEAEELGAAGAVLPEYSYAIAGLAGASPKARRSVSVSPNGDHFRTQHAPSAIPYKIMPVPTIKVPSRGAEEAQEAQRRPDEGQRGSKPTNHDRIILSSIIAEFEPRPLLCRESIYIYIYIFFFIDSSRSLQQRFFIGSESLPDRLIDCGVLDHVTNVGRRRMQPRGWIQGDLCISV
jgi:hypothetical protein